VLCAQHQADQVVARVAPLLAQQRGEVVDEPGDPRLRAREVVLAVERAAIDTPRADPTSV
jgi:hypothetical protein